MNFFSCLNMTVSSPTFRAPLPAPMVIALIGGSEAAPRNDFASSEASGQASSDACFAASFMANARQVGKPHFLQFVFGKCLNISTPESAILHFSFRVLLC